MAIQQREYSRVIRDVFEQNRRDKSYVFILAKIILTLGRRTKQFPV